VTELFRFCDCSRASFQQRCATTREFSNGQFADNTIDGPVRGSVHALMILRLPLAVWRIATITCPAAVTKSIVPPILGATGDSL